METIKDILYFCNAAIFYDYINIGILWGLNKIRNCVINNFYETIPQNRILITLGIFAEMIVKINDNGVNDIRDKLHDIRKNILYMIGFQKLAGEEKVEENNNE